MGLIRYDPKTGPALGNGGEATALTHNNDTYVMGIGPFRSGIGVGSKAPRRLGSMLAGGSFMSNPADRQGKTSLDGRSHAALSPNSFGSEIADLPSGILASSLLRIDQASSTRRPIIRSPCFSLLSLFHFRC